MAYHDLLDPQEGDVVAESTIHRRVVEGVADVLTRRLEDSPHVAVWCNLKIVFRIPGLTSGPGPDICVVEGVVDRDRERKSFHFGREPGKVRLVIEVVSEASIKKDYRDLLQIYAPMGVEEYVAICPVASSCLAKLRLIVSSFTNSKRAVSRESSARERSPPWTSMLVARPGLLTIRDAICYWAGRKARAALWSRTENRSATAALLS